MKDTGWRGEEGRERKATHRDRVSVEGDARSAGWGGSPLWATSSYRGLSARHTATCWRYRCDQRAVVTTYRSEITCRAGFQRNCQPLRPMGS